MSKMFNVVIVGHTSSGKTTLLNSIHSTTLSDMKRKKTTTRLNQYIEKPRKSLANVIDIQKKNIDDESKDDKNKELLDNKYYVNASRDFGDKLRKKGYYLNLMDTPGIDEDGGKEEIRLEQDFCNIHAILFVVNGETGLQTESEIKLLRFIIDNVKKNPHIVIIFIFNKFDHPDEEMLSWKKKSELLISEYIGKTGVKYAVIHMCAERAYMCRCALNDYSLTGLSAKYREDLSRSLLGSTFSELSEKQINNKVIHILEMENSYYAGTNYDEFITIFDKLIVKRANEIYTSSLKNKIMKQSTNNNITESIIKRVFRWFNTLDIIYGSHSELDEIFVKLFGVFLDNLQGKFPIIDIVIVVNKITDDYQDLLLAHYPKVELQILKFYTFIIENNDYDFFTNARIITNRMVENQLLTNKSIKTILERFYECHYDGNKKDRIYVIQLSENEDNVVGEDPSDHILTLMKIKQMNVVGCIDNYLLFLSKMINCNRIIFQTKNKSVDVQKIFNMIILQFPDSDLPHVNKCKIALASNSCAKFALEDFPLSKNKEQLIDNLIPVKKFVSYVKSYQK